MRKLKIFFLIVFSLSFSSVFAQQEFPIENIEQEIENSKEFGEDKIIFLIYTDTRWIGQIQYGDFVTHIIDGQGNDKFVIPCGDTNTVSISLNPTADEGNLHAYFVKDGKLLETHTISTNENTIESTIDCKMKGMIEELSLGQTEIPYVAIGIGMVIAVSIIVLKRPPFLGPRKFRV